VTEQDLEREFREFGEIESVQVNKDDNGENKGFGFVQ
jgi:RNA recognition motif-containing protein